MTFLNPQYFAETSQGGLHRLGRGPLLVEEIPKTVRRSSLRQKKTRKCGHSGGRVGHCFLQPVDFLISYQWWKKN